jgi:hypothetical protein
MNKLLSKPLWAHLTALACFLLVSAVFFAPMVFNGKVLQQPDNQRAYAMQTEITKYAKETGEYPLWTNSMFSGMPSYQIYTPNYNYDYYVQHALLLNQPMTSPFAVVFLAMLCCYLLLVTLRIDWRIAIMGALAFGLSSYNMDLAEAGHSNKLLAMAYVPALFAGAVLAFRGKYLLGGALFALFTSLQIYANHLQITYYTFILLVVLGIVELIYAIKEKGLPQFGKAAAALLVAFGIGLACNASKLLTTYEYSQETIRGKSELSAKAEKGSGLDYDYATSWSYGIFESLTTLAQNINGGGASQKFEGTAVHDRVFPNMRQQFVQKGLSPDQATKSAEQQVAILFYWGDQPFVGVAIYFGAIVWFLFVLGIFLVDGRIKTWLLASAIIALVIAWGKNFPLHELIFDHFPYYNKFRAVSMALGFGQLAFAALAALGLQRIFDKDLPTERKQKALKWSLGIVGGLCLLLILGSFGMNFSGSRDAQLPESLLPLVKEGRASLMRTDAFRSLVFILLAAALAWAYLAKKIKANWAVIGIGLLVLVDIWGVDKRILFKEKFEDPQQLEAAHQPAPANQQILQDADPHFRVLDLSNGNPFTSVDASRYHHSIGGYHAAKLMRYQELIDRYLSKPGESLDILGMLNTKYIIQEPTAAQRLPQALGNAWFVRAFKVVETPDEELEALANLKPGQEAVVLRSYANALDGLNIVPDSMATIKLTDYKPDKLTYEYMANGEQLAVFSEIYYPPAKGWNTYLDGQKYTDFIKADYTLRALRLPTGKHQVEMRFEPKSYIQGNRVSLIASVLTLLLAIGGIGFFVYKNGLPKVVQIEERAEEAKPVAETTSQAGASKHQSQPKGRKR